MTRQGDLSHYNSCNVLLAARPARSLFGRGAQWLDELRPVLADNIRYACDFIAAPLPGEVMQPQEPMLFLDCAAWLQEHHMTLRELEGAARVPVSSGRTARRLRGRTPSG